jgi:ribosomal protein L44E
LRARGPSLIRDLEKSKSTLTTCLNDYVEAIPQIAAEFGRVRAKLGSFERKVSGGRRRDVKRIRLLIDQCEVNAQNEAAVRNVHIELIKVIEDLKEHQKDLEWEI